MKLKNIFGKPLMTAWINKVLFRDIEVLEYTLEAVAHLTDEWTLVTDLPFHFDRYEQAVYLGFADIWSNQVVNSYGRVWGSRAAFKLGDGQRKITKGHEFFRYAPGTINNV